MAAQEVTQILLSAQSPYGTVRKVAEANLKQLQEQNFHSFILSLSHELANNNKPPESRRLAGLILKNSLDAKESSRKQELAVRWIALDPTARGQVKAALSLNLSSPVADARHTSAQVIAKVAAIELRLCEWPELVGSLVANMGGPTHLRQATLEALGYVCEEVSPGCIEQEQVNFILAAVVQGMHSCEPSNDVRFAATHALYHVLDFAELNFEKDVERDYIMRVVCEAATHSPDVRVRQVAFECLVSIGSLYYDKLAPYIGDIFAITSKAVKEDEEPVALQAIEFWSSICDEEIEIQEDDLPHFQFIKQTVPALVPLLLETLTKQEEQEELEEEAWNLAMAGGACLGLVARAVGDDVVPLVMHFVQTNIANSNWRSREAATNAFGFILEGPSLENLRPLVNLALNFMLRAMRDESNHVKATTAWTLGRIFECQHGVITQINLPSILEVLLESIKDTPTVAEKVCGAIFHLARGYGDSGAQAWSPLSPHFQSIIQALLVTAQREDLRAVAYEALNEMVQVSTKDTAPTLTELVPVIMQKLNHTFEMAAPENQSELQALLCGVLNHLIQKLNTTEVTKYADQIMRLFLNVLACRTATVHEEAMLAIGALAQKIGGEFGKYMGEFYRYLEVGLQNFEEYQVCAKTVGVLVDICGELDEQTLLPYCDGIMAHLWHALSSTQLHHSVKPPICSCLGDVAFAIGDHFERYLSSSMQMLQAAAERSAKLVGDDEMVKYNNELRSGILEAYSRIFQGLGSRKADLMVPYAEHILQFIVNVYQDDDRDEVVIKAAFGVLYDLVDKLGANVVTLLQLTVFWKHFLDECISSDDQQLKETAEWAQRTFARILFE